MRHSIAMQSLVAQLGALPGVQRVVIDDRGRLILLVCEPDANSARLLETAADRLRDLAIDDLELDVVFRARQREGRRIRFLHARRAEGPDRITQITVTLEWDGESVAARAPAGLGEASELRAVAVATLEAVARTVDRDLELRVGGVKRVRSFDTDLMVASLFRTGPGGQQLVGAVVAGDDSHAAACKAVLNALNRLLGNLLAR